MTAQADQHIDDLINRHEASWRLGYDAFPSVLNKLGLTRGAEIGVAFGGHSEAILQNTSVEKLYAIDSYKHRPEYDDPMNLPQHVFDRLYERTGQRLGTFGDRVQQIRLDSVDAAQTIDEQLDFVYIDGDHSYEGIRADLQAWFPLIREGGIIAGHDYGQPAFPGVKAAADHFFKRFGITVHHAGKGVWWAERPATPVTVVIAVSDARFCDATLHDQLKAAGLTEQDTVLLVHDEQHPCDAASRVLESHANVVVLGVADLCGPWHATLAASEQIATPLVFPIRLDTPLPKDALRTLRDRLCHSGAMAASFTTGTRTNDFALADFLGTSTPTAQPIVTTYAIKQAQQSVPAAMTQCSDRLIPWLILSEALANGGRLALEPSQAPSEQSRWNAIDCRLAAQAMLQHAELIDGSDLLRLKWPSVANNWLNTLDRKTVRTRVNVKPVDTPPTHHAPRMIDRVLHKVRRTIRRAA